MSRCVELLAAASPPPTLPAAADTAGLHPPQAFDWLKKVRQVTEARSPSRSRADPTVVPSQAESQLSEAASKESIDQIIFYARRTLLGKFAPPLPPTTTDELVPPVWTALFVPLEADDLRFPPPSDPALPSDWRVRVLKETRDILIDEEVQRRRAIKNTLANEGLEAKRQEEEIQDRKRKMDEKKTWEGASAPRCSACPSYAATH